MNDRDTILAALDSPPGVVTTGIIRGAARRVANLDYEAFHKALYEWYHSERSMSADEEKQLINTALGITTEDDE